MKKTIYLTLAFCAVCAMIVAGCSDSAPEAKKVTIMFTTGDGGSEVVSIEIKEDGSLPADYFGTGSKVPTRTGYTFNGWLDGTTPVTAATTFDVDTTLTAQWVLQQVTVSFSLGAGVTGTPPASVTINAGTALGTKYPANPEREGWEFDGWYNGTTRYTSATVINTTAATFTLTAHWEEIEDIKIYTQAPAIHPGRHLDEAYPTGFAARAGVEFTIEGLFSNVERDAGILTAQWYRAISEVNARQYIGEPVGNEQKAAAGNPNELSLKYTGTETEAGNYWYWVEVTNTNENATESKTATTRTMNQLKVTVTE